jgi:replicative DNA helicase
MADIEDAARRLSREHGALSLVIVDYAQEVADTDPRTPRYLTVGNVASRSIALAEELQAAVVIASQVNVVREGAEETFVMRESAILKHKAHFYLELAVEWDKLPDGTRRVKGARIRCPKARNGPAFELPIRYRPELYLVTDEVPA